MVLLRDRKSKILFKALLFLFISPLISQGQALNSKDSLRTDEDYFPFEIYGVGQGMLLNHSDPEIKLGTVLLVGAELCHRPKHMAMALSFTPGFSFSRTYHRNIFSNIAPVFPLLPKGPFHYEIIRSSLDLYLPLNVSAYWWKELGFFWNLGGGFILPIFRNAEANRVLSIYENGAKLPSVTENTEVTEKLDLSNVFKRYITGGFGHDFGNYKTSINVRFILPARLRAVMFNFSYRLHRVKGKPEVYLRKL